MPQHAVSVTTVRAGGQGVVTITGWLVVDQSLHGCVDSQDDRQNNILKIARCQVKHVRAYINKEGAPAHYG